LDPADDLFLTVTAEREDLRLKTEQLSSISTVEHADLAQLRFKNLINGYLSLEEELFTVLQNKGALSYANLYEQLNAHSTFITEESYQLISLELSTYQTWYNRVLIEIENIQ